jgi:hypothetical protein
MFGRCALRLCKCIHLVHQRGVLSRRSTAGSGSLVARHRQVHASCEVETGNGHKRCSAANQAHRRSVLRYKSAFRKRLAQRNASGSPACDSNANVADGGIREAAVSLQERGDWQNARTSHKTSHSVGWAVGWKFPHLRPNEQAPCLWPMPSLQSADILTPAVVAVSTKTGDFPEDVAPIELRRSRMLLASLITIGKLRLPAPFHLFSKTREFVFRRVFRYRITSFADEM